jgi:hypothetical protein
VKVVAITATQIGIVAAVIFGSLACRRLSLSGDAMTDDS